jgi:hypothetical protein
MTDSDPFGDFTHAIEIKDVGVSLLFERHRGGMYSIFVSVQGASAPYRLCLDHADVKLVVDFLTLKETPP